MWRVGDTESGRLGERETWREGDAENGRCREWEMQ